MSEKKRRRWGDRREGRLLRSLPPMARIEPYILNGRTSSQNLANASIASEPIDRYIKSKRAAGMPGFGFLHLFIAVYLRTICKYPGINRFIGGQKVYARDGVDVMFNIKKEMTLASEDTVLKMHFSPDATPEEVYRRVRDEVEGYRSEPDSGFDDAAKMLTYIPGVLLKFVVWLLKLLDYFDLLPKFLLKVSPFHGSIYLTDLGSLGIPPVNHHLYDFGNVPVFCAFGNRRRVNEVMLDGSVERRCYYDITVTLDERICDGFYLAAALKYFSKLMKDPFRLDEPVEEVVEDVE